MNFSSISFITNKALKVRFYLALNLLLILKIWVQVDASAIVDSHKKAPILEATSALEAIVTEWARADTLLEVDWSRIRTLEFQETLRARNERLKSLPKFGCTLCEDFDDHVSPRNALTPTKLTRL